MNFIIRLVLATVLSVATWFIFSIEMVNHTVYAVLSERIWLINIYPYFKWLAFFTFTFILFAGEYGKFFKKTNMGSVVTFFIALAVVFYVLITELVPSSVVNYVIASATLLLSLGVVSGLASMIILWSMFSNLLQRLLYRIIKVVVNVTKKTIKAFNFSKEENIEMEELVVE